MADSKHMRMDEGGGHSVPLAALGVDLEALVERLGGDASLVPEICGIFIANVPLLAATLDAACETRDGLAIAKAAHAIKGAVSNFTAGELLQSAAGVERSAKGGDVGAALQGGAMLRQRLTTFASAMQDTFERT